MTPAIGQESGDEGETAWADLKPGQRQLIRDQASSILRGYSMLGTSAHDVREALVASYRADADLEEPMIEEIFTDTRAVIGAAAARGHAVGSGLSLDSGWGFFEEATRRAALSEIRDEKPFCVILAFPAQRGPPCRSSGTRPWQNNGANDNMSLSSSPCRLRDVR